MENATKLARRFAGLLAVAALAVAGCGSSGGSTSSSSNAPSTTSSTTTSAPSSSASSSSNGIPQGPTAGDGDADNQGAPSDGDGNL